jgi:hypothetical protein
MIYTFRQKPSNCDFGGSVEDKWLSDSTNDLPQDDEGEVRRNKAAESCSYCGEDCPNNYALPDALDVEDPVGGEVDEEVDDHVRHWDDGDHCI